MQADDSEQQTTQKSRTGRWRWAALVAAVVVLGVGFAALGGAFADGSPKASPDPSSASDSSAWSTTRLLAHAECMRDHGVTNYPEPGGDSSGFSVADSDSPTYQSAQEKCQSLAPGAVKTQATSQQITKALQTASCMRDHGVTNFPDPVVTSTLPTPGSPSSGTAQYSYMYSNGILFKIPSSVVNSPAYQAAARTCNLNNLW